MYEASSIRMTGGRNRGVRAHKLFSWVPVGFVILFSKLRISDVKEHGNLQARYHVGIAAGKFLLTHTFEKPPHDLGLIVNHPVKNNPIAEWTLSYTKPKRIFLLLTVL